MLIGVMFRAAGDVTADPTGVPTAADPGEFANGRRYDRIVRSVVDGHRQRVKCSSLVLVID